MAQASSSKEGKSLKPYAMPELSGLAWRLDSHLLIQRVDTLCKDKMVEAEAQLEALQSDAGNRGILWRVALPGSRDGAPVLRVLTLTGTRVLNHFNLLEHKHQVPALQLTPRKRKLLTEDAATANAAFNTASAETSSSTHAPGSLAAALQQANISNHNQSPSSCESQPAVAELFSQQSEPAAVHTLVCILRGQAPRRLTMAQALALLDTCKFFTAHELLAWMPDYLQPILVKAPLPQAGAFLRHLLPRFVDGVTDLAPHLPALDALLDTLVRRIAEANAVCDEDADGNADGSAGADADKATAAVAATETATDASAGSSPDAGRRGGADGSAGTHTNEPAAANVIACAGAGAGAGIDAEAEADADADTDTDGCTAEAISVFRCLVNLFTACKADAQPLHAFFEQSRKRAMQTCAFERAALCLLARCAHCGGACAGTTSDLDFGMELVPLLATPDGAAAIPWVEVVTGLEGAGSCAACWERVKRVLNAPPRGALASVLAQSTQPLRHLLELRATGFSDSVRVRLPDYAAALPDLPTTVAAEAYALSAHRLPAGSIHSATSCVSFTLMASGDSFKHGPFEVALYEVEGGAVALSVTPSVCDNAVPLPTVPEDTVADHWPWIAPVQAGIIARNVTVVGDFIVEAEEFLARSLTQYPSATTRQPSRLGCWHTLLSGYMHFATWKDGPGIFGDLAPAPQPPVTIQNDGVFDGDEEFDDDEDDGMPHVLRLLRRAVRRVGFRNDAARPEAVQMSEMHGKLDVSTATELRYRDRPPVWTFDTAPTAASNSAAARAEAPGNPEQEDQKKLYLVFIVQGGFLQEPPPSPPPPPPPPAAPVGGAGFGAPAQQGGLFGAPAQHGGGLFGNAPQQPARAGGGLFGNVQPRRGGLFGNAPQQPAFGNAVGGLFGNAQPLGGGLFGHAPQQAAFGRAGGGPFGNAQPRRGGLFGNAPQQPAAGDALQHNRQQEAGDGLFGNALQQPAGAGGGPFGNAQAHRGGLFGIAPRQPAFGNAGGGLFGNAQPRRGGLFGNAPQQPAFGDALQQHRPQQAGDGLFGNALRQPVDAGGGPFGNAQPHRGGLFGNAPQQPAFGDAGGGPFGNVQPCHGDLLGNEAPRQPAGADGGLVGNAQQHGQHQPTDGGLFGPPAQHVGGGGGGGFGPAAQDGGAAVFGNAPHQPAGAGGGLFGAAPQRNQQQEAPGGAGGGLFDFAQSSAGRFGGGDAPTSGSIGGASSASLFGPAHGQQLAGPSDLFGNIGTAHSARGLFGNSSAATGDVLYCAAQSSAGLFGGGSASASSLLGAAASSSGGLFGGAQSHDGMFGGSASSGGGLSGGAQPHGVMLGAAASGGGSLFGFAPARHHPQQFGVGPFGTQGASLSGSAPAQQHLGGDHRDSIRAPTAGAAPPQQQHAPAQQLHTNTSGGSQPQQQPIAHPDSTALASTRQQAVAAAAVENHGFGSFSGGSAPNQQSTGSPSDPAAAVPGEQNSGDDTSVNNSQAVIQQVGSLAGGNMGDAAQQ